MGFRFRRRVRIAPGIALNISKSGVSTSIGGRGATINASRRGTRTTVGLPGTGLSYRTTRSPASGGFLSGIIGLAVICAALYACTKLL